MHTDSESYQKQCLRYPDRALSKLRQRVWDAGKYWKIEAVYGGESSSHLYEETATGSPRHLRPADTLCLARHQWPAPAINPSPSRLFVVKKRILLQYNKILCGHIICGNETQQGRKEQVLPHAVSRVTRITNASSSAFTQVPLTQDRAEGGDQRPPPFESTKLRAISAAPHLRKVDRLTLFKANATSSRCAIRTRRLAK